MVHHGAAWCGTARFGAVWRGMVRCGRARGLARYGKVRSHASSSAINRMALFPSGTRLGCQAPTCAFLSIAQ
eukprot:1230806-Lingulodinium_polyedra.AAC.1